MALVDYTLRLQNRFHCAAPQDASPQLKRANLLPAIYSVRQPHCVVDLEVGTRGVLCERTNANHYQGHVPDAPVMLGADRLGLYERATRETQFLSVRRACALGACLGLGLVAGLGGTGLVWLASVALHALAPATVPPLTAWAAQLCYGALSVATCSLLSGSENVEWQLAHDRFDMLASLARAHARGAHEGADAAYREHDRALLERSLESVDFAVQQAALELLAAGHLCEVPAAKAA